MATENRQKTASCPTADLVLTPEKTGVDRYAKISYPLRYGRYGEIRTKTHIFEFNLNGEIKTIRGRTGGWLQRAEWLKRTCGNDWAYFSAGGYTGAVNYTGEYYVPCLPYGTNAIFGTELFYSDEVREAFCARDRLMETIEALSPERLEAPAESFVKRIRKMPPDVLERRARRFHEIFGGPVTVLPPDTRHVEYDVIPLAVADGCLYNCGFCRVKSGQGFKVRTRADILRQLNALKNFFSRDLVNYSALFLGHHDALFAGAETLEFAAKNAYEILDFDKSFMKEPRCFLFGSVDSILQADADLLERLNRLPFATFINIGLESGDTETLKTLKKPLTAEKVALAFDRMLEINRKYNRIEISANFVIGENLPEAHLPSILELTRHRLDRVQSKGAIYLSPLEDAGAKDRLLSRFNEFKTLCRLPAYIYLIQRL